MNGRWESLIIAWACACTAAPRAPKLLPRDDLAALSVTQRFGNSALLELRVPGNWASCALVHQYGASSLGYDGVADEPNRSQLRLPMAQVAESSHKSALFVLDDCDTCTDLSSIAGALDGPLKLSVYEANCADSHLDAKSPRLLLLLRPGTGGGFVEDGALRYELKREAAARAVPDASAP